MLQSTSTWSELVILTSRNVFLDSNTFQQTVNQQWIIGWSNIFIHIPHILSAFHHVSTRVFCIFLQVLSHLTVHLREFKTFSTSAFKSHVLVSYTASSVPFSRDLFGSCSLVQCWATWRCHWVRRKPYWLWAFRITTWGAHGIIEEMERWNDLVEHLLATSSFLEEYHLRNHDESTHLMFFFWENLWTWENWRSSAMYKQEIW